MPRVYLYIYIIYIVCTIEIILNKRQPLRGWENPLRAFANTQGGPNKIFNEDKKPDDVLKSPRASPPQYYKHSAHRIYTYTRHRHLA